MRLDDLLDDSTIKKIGEILSTEESPHKSLVKILEPHRERLLNKEVYPEWLAYWIESKRNN